MCALVTKASLRGRPQQRSKLGGDDRANRDEKTSSSPHTTRYRTFTAANIASSGSLNQWLRQSKAEIKTAEVSKSGRNIKKKNQ